MQRPKLKSSTGFAFLIRDELAAASVVLAMGPGNPPAVLMWTAKPGLLCSKQVQKPVQLTLGWPNPDPYMLPSGFRED